MFIGESTKSGTDEGPQLDVPETETKAPKRRPKSKRGEEKSEGEEEILQLGKIAGSPPNSIFKYFATFSISCFGKMFCFFQQVFLGQILLLFLIWFIVTLSYFIYRRWRWRQWGIRGHNNKENRRSRWCGYSWRQWLITPVGIRINILNNLLSVGVETMCLTCRKTGS